MSKTKLNPFRPTHELRLAIAKELKSYAVYHEVNFVPTEVVRNIVRRLADKADMGMPTNRQIGPALSFMDSADMFYHYQSVPGSTGLEVGITPYYSMTWGKVMAEKARKTKRNRLEVIDKVVTGMPEVKDDELVIPEGLNILTALYRRKNDLNMELKEIQELIEGMHLARDYTKKHNL